MTPHEQAAEAILFELYGSNTIVNANKEMVASIILKFLPPQQHEADLKRLEREITRLKSALKQIAKPALGGKQQQWMAQDALRNK